MLGQFAICFLSICSLSTTKSFPQSRKRRRREGTRPRIVISSAIGHTVVPDPTGIDYPSLQVFVSNRAGREKITGLGLYAQSKMVSLRVFRLAVVLWDPQFGCSDQ